ncbi:MAG: hypothetical protein AAFY64_09065 [Pseudomonadota bacterium]
MDRVDTTEMVARRRASFMEGWRATPAIVRMVLGLFLGLSLATVAALLLQGPTPAIVVVLGLVLALLVALALIGTVLDVYATPEAERAQKWRSLAIGVGLLLMVGMFFAATIVRLGANVFNRAI